MSIRNMLAASVWLFVATTVAAHDGDHTTMSIVGTYLHHNQHLVATLTAVLLAPAVFVIAGTCKGRRVRIGQGVSRG